MLRGTGLTSNRSSLSDAGSYKEVGEYWNFHELTEARDKTRKVEFGVVIESERTSCAIEKDLSEKVHSLARKKGGVLRHPYQSVDSRKNPGANSPVRRSPAMRSLLHDKGFFHDKKLGKKPDLKSRAPFLTYLMPGPQDFSDPRNCGSA
jgi:hypothetical protein